MMDKNKKILWIIVAIVGVVLISQYSGFFREKGVIQINSVVGRKRGCSINPDYVSDNPYDTGDQVNVNVDDYCNSGVGLIDFYQDFDEGDRCGILENGASCNVDSGDWDFVYESCQSGFCWDDSLFGGQGFCTEPICCDPLGFGGKRLKESGGCPLGTELPLSECNGIDGFQTSELCYNKHEDGKVEWNPDTEYKNQMSRTCSDGPCNFQVYCCDEPECQLDSDCPGGECVTENYPTESDIEYEDSTFNYCSDVDMIECWYSPNNVECETKEYKEDLLEDCLTQTYMGKQLYNSEEECLDSIEDGNGEDGDGGDGKVEPITWSGYYSISDEKFMDEVGFCNSDDDCKTKEDLTPVCKKEGRVIDRWKENHKNICDKSAGWWNEFFDMAISAFPGGNIVMKVISGEETICEAYSELRDWMREEGGICMAESTGTFGQLWDEALKSVGGMGIPAEYVLMATLALLFGIAMIVINMIMKATG